MSDSRARDPWISPWSALSAILLLCAVAYGIDTTIRLRRAAEALAARSERPPLEGLADALPAVPGLAELRPSGRPGRIERAVVEAEASGDEAALVETLRAIHAVEKDVWAGVELGVLAVRHGRHAEARELLLPGLDLEATRDKAAFHLFLAAEGLGAREAAREALAAFGTDPSTRWALLAVAIRTSREPGARPEAVSAAFDAAVRARPAGADGVWAHLYRAAWRESRADAAGAQADLEAARAIDPLASLPGSATKESER